MRRVGLSRCRQKLAFRCRRTLPIAKRSNKQRSIARCTRAFLRKSVDRPSLSGKADSHTFRPRSGMLIRKAVETDVSKLLVLMRELARFEKYIDAFAITADPLVEQGFRRSPPDFQCFVGEEDGELLGMLVYYFIPFTYRAKPNVIVKELYVSETARGRGIGKLLMRAVANEAVKRGSGAIKWYVANWNNTGIDFYERLGAKLNRDWLEFEMSEEMFRRLAAS